MNQLVRDIAARVFNLASPSEEVVKPRRVRPVFTNQRMASIRSRIRRRSLSWSLFDVQFLLDRIDQLEAELAEQEDFLG